MIDLRILFGVGGVAPHDTPAAHRWAHRLRWPMTVTALLALPALWFDLSPAEAIWHHLRRWLDAFILLAFSAELLWMMHVSREPWRYAWRNWLNLVIITAAVASLFGLASQWVALTRLMRVAWASLLLTRSLAMVRELFRKTATLWVLAAGVITLALSGEVFYWLEPTVNSYGEGLWLAFATGSTIGYGDVIPTTTASRFFAMIVAVLGFGMLSLTTASIAVFFIEEDEKKLRREMHHDIRLLYAEVAALRAEIHALRADPQSGFHTDK
jgi:voltage-gated potassium channel